MNVGDFLLNFLFDLKLKTNFVAGPYCLKILTLGKKIILLQDVNCKKYEKWSFCNVILKMQTMGKCSYKLRKTSLWKNAFKQNFQKTQGVSIIFEIE